LPSGTSATQNPVIIFSKPGTYNVTLVATNGSGSSVAFGPVVITVFTGC
jgi:surface-anchored protein